MKTEVQADINLTDKHSFVLQGVLNFVTVPALVMSAQKALQHLPTNHFEVNLEKVKDSDSAGIALLLEINRIALSLNKTMKISNMSPQMEIIARAYGVDKSLNTMTLNTMSES